MAVASRTERDAFRARYARAARPASVRRVSEEIAEAVHGDLPELDADADLRRGTFASTESVLPAMAEMVRIGTLPSEGRLPPAAEETCASSRGIEYRRSTPCCAPDTWAEAWRRAAARLETHRERSAVRGDRLQGGLAC